MNKYIILIFAIYFCVGTALGQAVSVNNTGAIPNAAAMMDVDSQTKGFLPPRMTTSQRDDIANPAAGLLIYNFDTHCINVFDGSSWVDHGRDPLYGVNCGGDFTDPRDSKTYSTVLIGQQCWMAENLRATVYPDLEPIPHVSESGAWAALTDDNSADGYSFYLNNSGNDYGPVYTYAAAIGKNWLHDNADGQGICPDGWHLPTGDEWGELSEYLGGNDLSGGKMKEIGTTHWNSPNTGATNESGFTAIAGGYRAYYNGNFYNISNNCYWWAADESSSVNAYVRYLSYSDDDLRYSTKNKSYGYFVRCLFNGN